MHARFRISPERLSAFVSTWLGCLLCLLKNSFDKVSSLKVSISLKLSHFQLDFNQAKISPIQKVLLLHLFRKYCCLNINTYRLGKIDQNLRWMDRLGGLLPISRRQLFWRPVCLIHLCRVNSSTLSLWTGPFPIEGVSGVVFFYYNHILLKFLY